MMQSTGLTKKPNSPLKRIQIWNQPTNQKTQTKRKHPFAGSGLLEGWFYVATVYTGLDTTYFHTAGRKV